MQNLAGHKQAHELVCTELERAGVRCFPVSFVQRGPEVPARVVGVIAHADGAITVMSRLWYYFAVNSSKPLMRDPGMGHVVRVEGFASPGKAFNRRTGCSGFHVDTEDGLAHLVKALVAEHGADTGRTPSWEEVRHYLNDAVFAPA